MITAHLKPNTQKAAWYVLHAETPDEPSLVSHFYAENEDEALCFAGSMIQKRWPDKNIDIDLHVHEKGTP